MKVAENFVVAFRGILPPCGIKDLNLTRTWIEGGRGSHWYQEETLKETDREAGDIVRKRMKPRLNLFLSLSCPI